MYIVDKLLDIILHPDTLLLQMASARLRRKAEVKIKKLKVKVL